MKNPIDACFERLRLQRRKAFIPFLTAGDPDLNATRLLVQEMASRGAGLIEIGFPYSDSIADGPVIQASYNRALAHGLHVDDIFTALRQWVDTLPGIGSDIPLVGMVSYSLVQRRKPERFLQQAQAAGLSGAIVPDLPIEEAEDFAKLASDRNFKLIHLVTPSTPRERALRIMRLSTGFLYCVSIVGITGERDCLPQELLGQMAWLRQHTDLPLCIGFGISKPEHVHALREAADGIIVGSALVRCLERATSQPITEVVHEVGKLAESLNSH